MKNIKALLFFFSITTSNVLFSMTATEAETEDPQEEDKDILGHE